MSKKSILILLRHGQSLWNLENRFTGWVDVPLSEKGIEEARQAGQEIAKISLNRVYVSTLSRALMTAQLALLHHSENYTPLLINELGEHEGWDRFEQSGGAKTLPLYPAWQLNERCYGDLQGLNKDEMRKKYGPEQVQIWRRSFEGTPPGGESLKATSERTLPYFKHEILPHLANENILISAHGNSLRSIVMSIEGLSEEEVVALELPTGEPRIYEFEAGQFTRV